MAHAGFADPVCPSSPEAWRRRARGAGLTVHRGGTYVCMEGPQFSTRAESKLYRSWGADVIGMTNLTEARLAREAELCYASLALVTDYDCWRDATEDVSVEVIVAILGENAAAARRTLAAAVARVDPGRSCGCRDCDAFRNHHGSARRSRSRRESGCGRSRGGTCEDGRTNRRDGIGGLRLPHDLPGKVHRAPDPGPDVAPVGLVSRGRDAACSGRMRPQHRVGTGAARRAAGAARHGRLGRGRVPGPARPPRASTSPG